MHAQMKLYLREKYEGLIYENLLKPVHTLWVSLLTITRSN